MRRIPAEDRKWLPGHHPDGALYRENALVKVPVIEGLSDSPDCVTEGDPVREPGTVEPSRSLTQDCCGKVREPRRAAGKALD